MTTATKQQPISEQLPYCKPLTSAQKHKIINFLLGTEKFANKTEKTIVELDWNECSDLNLIETANHHCDRLCAPRFEFAYYSQNQAGKEKEHVL